MTENWLAYKGSIISWLMTKILFWSIEIKEKQRLQFFDQLLSLFYTFLSQPSDERGCLVSIFW